MLAATKRRYDVFVKCLAAGMFQNGTQAAIEAGYKPSRASDQAMRLCRNEYVKAEIVRLKAILAAKHDITAERIVKEYAKVGFTNMEDFTQDSDDGLTLKDLASIGRDNMAAVESVKITTTTERDGRGRPMRTHRTTQFKLYSKLNALDALGKHLGIFEADNTQRGQSIADIFAIMSDRS